ncbi:hypothetical protein DFH08DRAFT_823487 [Mycena albidolilacea]|uniref:Uncharacterized protein n=1 Tax=Mycena albidolilacea TaxID=1033008 RepID=A0AAD6Z6K0_9AGAR|nr:hypothetical protein DFH08DRAFT_823487 [Mycena albidolilacea]
MFPEWCQVQNCGIHANTETQVLTQEFQCAILTKGPKSWENVEEPIEGAIREIVEETIRIKLYSTDQKKEPKLKNNVEGGNNGLEVEQLHLVVVYCVFMIGTFNSGIMKLRRIFGDGVIGNNLEGSVLFRIQFEFG